MANNLHHLCSQLASLAVEQAEIPLVSFVLHLPLPLSHCPLVWDQDASNKNINIHYHCITFNKQCTFTVVIGQFKGLDCHYWYFSYYLLLLLLLLLSSHCILWHLRLTVPPRKPCRNIISAQSCTRNPLTKLQCLLLFAQQELCWLWFSRYCNWSNLS